MTGDDSQLFESLPRERITLRFTGAYYFASQLDTLMTGDRIHSRALSDYFSSAMAYYVLPFQKWTAVHIFSSHFVAVVFC
jgi:hypothetical protein